MIKKLKAFAKAALRHAADAIKDVPMTTFTLSKLLIDAAEKNRFLRRIVRFLKRSIVLVLYALSPALGASMQKNALLKKIARNITVLILGMIFGYFISYTLNAWAAGVSGTFFGNDSTVYYFNDDEFNRQIYKVWAPLYMGFSIAVIYLSSLYWNDLHDLANHHSKSEIIYDHSLRSFAAFLTITLFTLVFLQRYFYNLPIENSEHKLYWFYSRDSSGVRLNFAGLVYVSTIFVKLFVLFIALACYISIAIEWAQLMAGFAKQSRIEKGVQRDYVRSVVECNRIYFYILCLFVVLIFHNQVWSRSFIGKSGVNVYLVASFLLCVFLFLMALPRIYTRVEYRNRNKYQSIFELLDENTEYLILKILIITAYGLIYGKILWPLVQFIAGSDQVAILDIIPEFLQRATDAWVSIGKIPR